jgi:pimeloyl-ACP methyl ester carboxylesterase
LPYFTSDGANIFLDVAGSGSPLLLLHGFSLDHRQWAAQAPAYAAHHQTFTMDLRGHGRSASPPRGYTYLETARDVSRAMVQIGMDRLNPGFVVGHSLSADAALQVALSEPRSLRGVVVVTPAVWGQRWSDGWVTLWRGMRAEVRAGRREAAFERFRADAIFDGLRRYPDRMAAVAEMQAQCTGAQLVHDERDAGEPTLERLAACKVPVLVVSTSRDRDDFRTTAAEVAARAPDSETVVLDGCGHFPNLESPDAFDACVLEFVSRHTEPAPPP